MTASLFAGLDESVPDPILHLMEAYRADPRPERIDLGVGMYRDAQGTTPVMAAVKTAEQRIWTTQDSKSYVGLAGDPEFRSTFAQLALGDLGAATRCASVATPGGTGAIHQGFLLHRKIQPDATIWVSQPGWPNHDAIAVGLGRPVRRYAYARPGAATVDPDRLLDDLTDLAAGDLLVLQGCCHNPTGLDPSPELWHALADLCVARGALPLVDLAYQGLGDGLSEDTAGLRILAAGVPELMLALSGAKNFGLYRERVGLLVTLCQDPATAQRSQNALNILNRLTYTFPPDHGARIVQTILTDADLRTEWEAELSQMRARITRLRNALATAFAQEDLPGAAGLRAGKGMFVQLDATDAMLAKLREDHGIYMVPGGRTNIAGLPESAVDRFARIFAEVTRRADA